jgi:L-malate glycosyltransferase
MIKITHILLSLEYGGAEKVAVNLINKIQGNGFNFSVCALDKLGGLENELGKGIKVECMHRRKGIDFTLPIRLSKAIKRLSPDIVHIHNPTPLLYGAIATKLAGSPRVIVTQHGKILKENRNRRLFTKRLSGSLDKTIAVSDDVANYLNGSCGIKNEIIINGIDETIYKKDEAKRILGRLQFGFDDEIVIGHVARLSPEKDQETLLKAFAQVAKQIDKARLVIVGDGRLRDGLWALGCGLGLKDKVIFAGEQKDIPAYLNIFDLFALSSVREGTSLTLLEAMATQLPIVATDVGGNSKVVVNNETGILVPPKDPDRLAEVMLYLIEHPGLRENMGRAARQRVEKEFSLTRMAHEYARVYRELVGHGS